MPARLPRGSRARRCSAASSSRCRNGTTTGYVDKLVLMLAVFLVVQTTITWLRASCVVRALGEDVRRAARGLHASRARAAALDRRACGHGRPDLAHDGRRRRDDAHDPLRRAGDADRGGHRRAHRGGCGLGQPDRRSAVHRGSAGARDRHTLVPASARPPATSGSARPTRRSPAPSARRSKAGARSRRWA